MMVVQQTSILAYQDVDLKGQYMKILNAMNPTEDYSNRELERITGLPISSVTARIHELRYKNPPFVVFFRKRPCRITNKTVMCWRRMM